MPKIPEGAPQTPGSLDDDTIRIQGRLMEVWAQASGHEMMDWTEGDRSMAKKFRKFLNDDPEKVTNLDLSDAEEVKKILKEIEQVEL